MKKLAVFLCLSALATGAFAQGLINFFNNPATLISLTPQGGPSASIPSGQGGSYWFALLSAPTGTVDPHLFTQVGGIYGTNQNAAGRFLGGNGMTAAGWAAGETRAFEIVAWSADNGSTFNPAWMAPGNVVTPAGDFVGCGVGWFGVSAIAPAGVAGGGPQSLPNLNVFGGAQGIQTGFTLVLVPEPTTLALAGLGAAALLIFRRRN